MELGLGRYLLLGLTINVIHVVSLSDWKPTEKAYDDQATDGVVSDR